jgi:hypothetical protein
VTWIHEVREGRIIIIRWSGQRPAAAVLEARDLAGERHAALIGRPRTFVFDTRARTMVDAMRPHGSRLGAPATGNSRSLFIAWNVS